VPAGLLERCHVVLEIMMPIKKSNTYIHTQMIDESAHIWKFLCIFLLILLVVLSLVFVFFSFGNKIITQHSKAVEDLFFDEEEPGEEEGEEENNNTDPNFTSLKELIELSSY
jgi:flagellar basal body-associated protein FliL